jgi:hypothetical protein
MSTPAFTKAVALSNKTVNNLLLLRANDRKRLLLFVLCVNLVMSLSIKPTNLPSLFITVVSRSYAPVELPLLVLVKFLANQIYTRHYLNNRSACFSQNANLYWLLI